MPCQVSLQIVTTKNTAPYSGLARISVVSRILKKKKKIPFFTHCYEMIRHYAHKGSSVYSGSDYKQARGKLDN